MRLLDPATETEGGLALPEITQDNRTDAEVIAAGDGKDFGAGFRCVMMADPGDRIILEPHQLKQIDPRQGVVSELHVLAIIRASAPDYLEPANGYVLVRPQRAPRRFEGSVIERPETLRQAPCCGEVLNYGPGEIRTTGPFAGLRKTIAEQLGEQLQLGAVVHWLPTAKTFVLDDPSAGETSFLVHASDLFAVEA